MSHPRISGGRAPVFLGSGGSYALTRPVSNLLFKRGREHTAIHFKRKRHFSPFRHRCFSGDPGDQQGLQRASRRRPS